MADCMPDLSHLSAEERAIIEEVFQRQKQEEATEKQIEQRADQELDNIEKQISDRKQAAARLVGTQDDAICQICQVTKFADGIGHKCFYCQLRSCARCGGRTQSKGKPIWACSMCQKKQSILAKTGKWFQQEKGLTDSPMEGPTPSTSSMNLQATSNGPMDKASTKVSNALGPGQQPMQQLQQQQTPSPMGMQQPGMMQPMQQQHPSPMAMQHGSMNQLNQQQQQIPNNVQQMQQMQQPHLQQQQQPGTGPAPMQPQQHQQHQQPGTMQQLQQLQQPMMGQMGQTMMQQQQQRPNGAPANQPHPQQLQQPQQQPAAAATSVAAAPAAAAQAVTSGVTSLFKGITGGIKGAVDNVTKGTTAAAAAVTGTQQQQQQMMQQGAGYPQQQQQQQPGQMQPLQQQPGMIMQQGQQRPMGGGVQQRRGPYGDGRRQGTMNRQGSVESSGACRQDANGSVGRGDGMMRKGQRREERPVFYTDSADLAADGNMTPLRKTSHRPRPPGSDLTIDEQYGGQGSSSGPGPSPHSAHSTRTEFRRTRSIRQDENNRRGSISARLQEVAPVPPASATGVRKKKSQLHRQMRSMSSSDEESQQPSTATGQQSQSQLQHMQQQPGYQQATDAMGRGCDPRIPRDDLQRLPQECTSEKDLLRYIYGNDLGRGANGKRRQQMERARSVEERYPPTATRRPFSAAGFTPSYGRGGVMAGDALAKTIRNFLSQPVSWQPSADGRRLIGHIVLYRADTMPSGDLGLKVIGGRRSETGRLGAFVTQVRTGSVADTIGKLRAGDEVLEWNGQVLENATYDRVYEVISGSKHDQQVELIVSRSASIPGSDDYLNIRSSFLAQSQQQQLQHMQHSPLGLQQQVYVPQRMLPDPSLMAPEVADYTLHTPPGLSPNLSGYGMQSHHHQLLPHSQSAILPSSLLPHGSPHKSSVPMYYGSSFYNPAPPMLPLQLQRGQIFGRIEIALYYSVQDRELTVKVIRALDLSPRPDGIPRSPYCKLFLLPDRSEKSRRQSDVLAETAMPFWDKSFYYRGLGDEDLLERVLEVTLWDYDKFEANSFLGEVLIDFTETPLDGQPLLYTLVDMDDENPLRMRLRERRTMAITPRRPHSEIGHYGAYRQGGHHNHHHHPLDTMEPLIDYPYDRAPYDERQYSDNTMRRSRTYDRAGGRVEDDRRRGEGPPLSPSPRGGVDTEDWTLQKQNSGYLSDYGYAQAPPQATRYKQRRPRSATALRLTQDQMSASRMYNRYLPDEPPPNPDDPPDLARLGISARMDPRSPNGRVMASETAGGYGSDGSETLSAHSNHSVPIVRTINRRRTPEDIMAEEQEERRRERNHHSRDDDSQRGRSSEKGGNGTDMQSMKERKKSLMTRFIPGKGAAAGKRTGFARSEEVGIPSALGGQTGSIGGGGSGTSLESRLQAPFLKQTSKESTDSSYSDNWPPVVPDGQLGSFIDNLGPGQVVGRQVLASPVLGEIHLGIAASRSGIDVEVLQAKNLVVKPGIKICPAPYVKVYLMEGKTCVAKAKTNAVRKTTNPLFQQHLIFSESPRNKMLQVTVLGDYGRMERKAFMGIAQIRLDDLQLGPEPLIGLYKLFHSSSLAGTGPIRKDSETSLADPAQ